MTEVKVILGFRDWHLAHLDRCLRSLRASFLTAGVAAPVHVVDLGSAPAIYAEVLRVAANVGAMVTRHARGEWSRSVALNLGATETVSPDTRYFVFTDADMLFPAGWASVVRARLAPDRLLLTPSRDLPDGWADALGDALPDAAALRQASVGHPAVGQGAAMVVPRVWFETVRGFDETYSVWGSEDNDLVFRAQWDGLEVEWLTGTFVAHQWHDRTWPTPAQWAQVARNREYLGARVQAGGPVTRNPNGWGVHWAIREEVRDGDEG